MAAVAEKLTKRWTYEEYYNLDDDQRYELIDGNLILMTPGPDTWHQSWLQDLDFKVSLFVRRRKLGKVFFAPTDVVLDDENTVQPDLIFVAKTNLGIIKPRAIFGAPDLVVEMLSPSSEHRDRYEKQRLYARFGVKEYWIGDPIAKTIEVLTLRDNHYQIHCRADETRRLKSAVLAGLEFDLTEI